MDKIVDIKNIEVFEQAAEGLAVGRSTSSITSDTVKADLYDIKEYMISFSDHIINVYKFRN